MAAALTMRRSTFDTLPEDALGVISEYLDIKTICGLSTVSKTMNLAVTSDVIWSRIRRTTDSGKLVASYNKIILDQQVKSMQNEATRVMTNKNKRPFDEDDLEKIFPNTAERIQIKKQKIADFSEKLLSIYPEIRTEETVQALKKFEPQMIEESMEENIKSQFKRALSEAGICRLCCYRLLDPVESAKFKSAFCVMHCIDCLKQEVISKDEAEELMLSYRLANASRVLFHCFAKSVKSRFGGEISEEKTEYYWLEDLFRHVNKSIDLRTL